MSDPQRAVLRAFEGKSLSRKEIFYAIGLTGDSRAFKRTIEPLMIAELVERTLPSTPNSSLQKYRLTFKGKAEI